MISFKCQRMLNLFEHPTLLRKVLQHPGQGVEYFFRSFHRIVKNDYRSRPGALYNVFKALLRRGVISKIIRHDAPQQNTVLFTQVAELPGGDHAVSRPV